MLPAIRSLANFWLHRVHPRLISLITTIGISSLIVCVAIVYILGELFEEVWEKDAFRFDTTFLLWLHQFANSNWDRLALTVTNFANPAIVVPSVFISFSIMYWRNYLSEAKMFAIACFGAFILNTQLKLVFSKPRPQLFPQLIKETSFSFPSGHALGSLVLYGFLGYVLAAIYPKYALVIYALTGAMILAIGTSRLYLGVHWPTDVIAGYGVGFLWLMTCITMLKLQKLNRDRRP